MTFRWHANRCHTVQLATLFWLNLFLFWDFCLHNRRRKPCADQRRCHVARSTRLNSTIQLYPASDSVDINKKLKLLLCQTVLLPDNVPKTRYFLLIPDICHFFSTYPIFGSIFSTQKRVNRAKTDCAKTA